MNKRKIAIFTGNRAEYGLQYPIIRAIDKHPELEYYLLVSGAHLDEDFGQTKSEIMKDGFRIHAEVKLKLEQDNLYATALAIGSGILSLSSILNELKPDFLLVYADRYEGFSAVITGSQMNVPIGHIEGGDLTEGGALDDSVRHAMTKLSHLHFCTNEESKKRILSLGEEPWRVHNVGFPAIDLLADGNFATPQEIEEKYGLHRNRPIIVFTQHSVTTEFNKAALQVQPSLDALIQCAREGIQVVITYPNNDAGGRRIIKVIEQLRLMSIPNIIVSKNLGRYIYHGILKMCGLNGVCVGNSSSGIKETPFFGCPTVNIGSRQNGRLRSTNVIDVPYDKKDIISAINKCLSDNMFRKECASCTNPYGTGNSGKRIADTLASVPTGRKMIQKRITY
ncbi:UDP-N-acetylglucosamine 2-epimerase (hydrolyzing) [Candidatus Parcubacteria bacterium]|nr:MAG: UDP-N-acetylglucosamine 2-epimerase (hydrolyzing) [Candidatus Parcubacteria bacterium]